MRDELKKFNETVDILVKAYFNGTLIHDNCYACAVGNIIADKCGFKFVKCIDRPHSGMVWDITKGRYNTMFDMLLIVGNWLSAIHHGSFVNKETDRQLKATGYSIEQLRDIEYAFENVPYGKSNDEYMFNGLMSVIEVLADIHKVDLTTQKQACQRFVRA